MPFFCVVFDCGCGPMGVMAVVAKESSKNHGNVYCSFYMWSAYLKCHWIPNAYNLEMEKLIISEGTQIMPEGLKCHGIEFSLVTHDECDEKQFT